MKTILVVNMKGTVNQSSQIKRTLELLKLETKFRATIIPDNKTNRGMLHKVKNHVAWHDADETIIHELLEKRGKESSNKKITENTLKNNGYKTMKDLANEIFLGKKTLSSLKVKSTFTLSPPKGGFLRSTRRMYTQGGILGKNPQLNDIVLKMI